jgi:hypothetical protein
MQIANVKRGCIIVSLAASAILLSANDAHAYLDPGTGSILLQALIGGIAAGLVVIKLYWHKFKVLLGLTQQSQGAASDRIDESTNR